MDDERKSDLLIRAAAIYSRVVAEPGASGPVALRLVAEARAAGDVESLIMALRAGAWVYRTRMAYDRARAFLDEAGRTARRHHLKVRLGEVLVTRGVLNEELGRMRAAQRDFDQAADLVSPEMSAELASQQGALHQNMGRLAEAGQTYRRLLSSADLAPEVRTRAANNLALIAAQRGRLAAALGWLDQAAAAAEHVGPAYVAIVAETRASVMVQAGMVTEGLAGFEEASRLWEAAGLSLAELHAEYADALMELRLLAEAGEQAHLAVELLERRGVHLMAAEAQLRAARLALLQGHARAAARIAEETARRMRAQRRRSWAARADLIAVDARFQTTESLPIDLQTARRAAIALEGLGMPLTAVEAYLSAGRIGLAFGRIVAARNALGRAHELSRRAPVLVRLKGRIAAALAARLGQQDGTVLRHSRAGLQDLARHRAALASRELRALASGHGAELGRLGLEALVRSGSPARVFDWMERTRAAALSAVELPIVEEVQEELAALRAVHAAILDARRETGREPTDLLARQTDLEARIRRATWARQSSIIARAERASTQELRRLLDGQMLVEYDILDGQVLAAVLEPRRTRLVELGSVETVRFEVSALLFALRRLARPRSARSTATARDNAAAALRRLAGMLVDPLQLPDHDGLVVVPVGDLQRIPWSAVHALPVSIAPSASIWARSARSVGGRREVVLVAGPDVPGGANEVEVLRGLYPRSAVLLPPASTVHAVTAALTGAGLAHLACHGRVRADNPIFSALLLSDGPLAVHELDDRGAVPHRIVLASCESGSEVAYEGNETLGFVSSLLARGTAGLVASAVVVPDWDIVPLMCALHERVQRGDTLAVALHAARATVDQDDPASFVCWCAFNAFGAA